MKLARTGKGRQSFFSSGFSVEKQAGFVTVAFGIYGQKRLKTLPRVIVKAHHIGHETKSTISLLLYGWSNNDRGIGGKNSFASL